ncbi:hypothetical protein L3Q82_009861, partial [Scortum barcoo]
MDEGLRRYFARRVLVPLPDSTARHQIVNQLLAQSQHKYCLSEEELVLLVQRTEGFSGLDLARLCQEALVGLLHVSAQGMDMSGTISAAPDVVVVVVRRGRAGGGVLLSISKIDGKERQPGSVAAAQGESRVIGGACGVFTGTLGWAVVLAARLALLITLRLEWLMTRGE